jgi:hypothetical protein
MHSALRAAKREHASRADNEGLEIQLRHLLPHEGAPDTEALASLIQKYIGLQGYLLAKLSADERQEVFQLAGEPSCPTLEHPELKATAAWELKPLGIPSVLLDDVVRDRWRYTFSQAGYRVHLSEGEVTEYDAKPGLSAFKLWIPWGMTEYFRRVRRSQGGC